MTARNNRGFVRTQVDPDRYKVMQKLLREEWAWIIGNTIRERVSR